ncbi:KpsF/GutQ family sugar-phosphate isomerase [Amnimonas aquatica]|uniref:Arabinose 5-phosphate isomerase n=1 Tax=Amnimonas aquatica TaxID=2094561 RepID=A0A2P6AVD4_9GAMM|nr:KpsF/GutQ family sugar-phosphate isomerase [Amnimonas aquatica]PQA52123.1 D-arabinose 5-phosphate isomerase [Amnimonas aquatica]
MSRTDFVSSGLRVLQVETDALEALRPHIGEGFRQACALLLACQGRVVVSGMGKSGHIGNKIAATLASTGTPAFFMHPGEASHGDLGMVTGQDVVIAISNSGEAHEILAIIPVIKRRGAKLITITALADCSMGRFADVALTIGKSPEACPLGLAPTSSTTSTLVLGDALAVALLEARGFTAEDFALSHPGGALGRRLLLLVDDIMHKDGQVPVVGIDTTIRDALLEITAKGLGMTTVVDHDGRLAGLYTDGDLRRSIDQNLDIRSTPIGQVMTPNCLTVPAGILAAEALARMEARRVNGVVVVDADGRPVGAANMHGFLRAGVV